MKNPRRNVREMRKPAPPRNHGPANAPDGTSASLPAGASRPPDGGPHPGPDPGLLEELTADRQMRLFREGAGTRFAPETLLSGAKVPRRFRGRASLTAMARFNLLVYRSRDGEIYGRTETAVSPLIGPGYFHAASDDAGRGSVVLRYSEVPQPDDRPEGWPPVVPNDRGLGSVTFSQMEIALRRAGDDLFVGEIWKGGQNMNLYVALLRE